MVSFGGLRTVIRGFAASAQMRSAHLCWAPIPRLRELSTPKDTPITYRIARYEIGGKKRKSPVDRGFPGLSVDGIGLLKTD